MTFIVRQQNNTLECERIKMKKLVVASTLLVLTLTTGFTCSKNAPEQAAPAADQAQMAAPAPADAAAPAPTEGAAPAPADAAAPAPAEGTK